MTVALLPSEVNHHWTNSLAAGPDGRFLYVGIGSDSDIGERGMAVLENRALIWQVDVQTGATRPYATGLRNPTALAIAAEARHVARDPSARRTETRSGKTARRIAPIARATLQLDWSNLRS